jgi:hypothetical protein
MRGLSFTLAAVLLLACGCVEPDGTWTDDAAIYGGQPTSEYKAVVAYAVEDMSVPDQYWFSSGVLVGRRTVLVSASSASYATDHDLVYFGSDSTVNGTIKTVSERILHPDYLDGDPAADVAIVILEGASDLDPVPPNPTPLDTSWIGTTLTLVGMGTDDPHYSGYNTTFTKRATTVSIDHLDDGLLWHLTPGHNACPGDSGAPLFAHVDGEERVVALASDDWSPHGGNPCSEGGGVDVRLDVHYDWIEPYLDVPDEEDPWASNEMDNSWCSCSAPGEGPAPWRLGVLWCGVWLVARRLRAPARR